MIQNFDMVKKDDANLFGTWDKDPNDSSQYCRMTINQQVTYNQTGSSLQLDYDVESTNPAFNGFWMKLNNINISDFDHLVFWAKSIDDKKTTLKVELKSGSRVGSVYVQDIGSEWKKLSLPLSDFKGLSDVQTLSEFVVVFEDRMVGDKTGTIYLDEIQFLKK